MKSKTILLIEDDYLDIKSAERALKKLKVIHTLHIAHNGVDALAMITGSGPGGVKIIPDIILLDINMPKMNGIEFLRIIKNYYSLGTLKVFITTTSAEEYDKIAAENLGIMGYIIKPFDVDNSSKNKSHHDTSVLISELLS